MHCMASFKNQNLKTCQERLHSTRTKLLHLRNATYGWPNSHRKLSSRDWLIWNKMALQLQQRTPHWQLSYRRIMVHNLSPNSCWPCFTSSFNPNLNILQQLQACINKVFCKHYSNTVTHFQTYLHCCIYENIHMQTTVLHLIVKNKFLVYHLQHFAIQQSHRMLCDLCLQYSTWKSLQALFSHGEEETDKWGW